MRDLVGGILAAGLGVMLFAAGVPLNPGADRAPGVAVVSATCDSVNITRDGRVVATFWPLAKRAATPREWLIVTDDPEAYDDSTAVIHSLSKRYTLVGWRDPGRMRPGRYVYAFQVWEGGKVRTVPGGVLTVDKRGRRTFERGGESRK